MLTSFAADMNNRFIFINSIVVENEVLSLSYSFVGSKQENAGINVRFYCNALFCFPMNLNIDIF